MLTLAQRQVECRWDGLLPAELDHGHIDLLAQILAVAVDHGHIPSNPVVGKRRRLRVPKPRPVHLDSAEQIAILLEAAGQLDRGEAVLEVRDRHGRTGAQRQPVPTSGRRAAIATLLLGGGRASATGAMLWRDVDLANGRFEVGRDKTDAGMREVDMLPLLQEIRTEHKAASERTGPDDPVSVTSAGKPRSRHNIRQDVVEAVSPGRTSWWGTGGYSRLPLGITLHQLRHTFASILVAIGKDTTYVMHQLGHTRPGLHAAGLRAHDAAQRGGARASQGARSPFGQRVPSVGRQPPARPIPEQQKALLQRAF